MKNKYLLNKATFLLANIALFMFSCNDKGHQPITPGTTWLHPAANDEFYHYWKDSTLPAVWKSADRTHLIDSIKVSYCRCLFPLYYEMKIVTRLFNNTGKIQADVFMGSSVMTYTRNNWPEINMDSAPWNE